MDSHPIIGRIQPYNRDDTQDKLLDEILVHLKNQPESKIAILAAPTLYCKLFNRNPEIAKQVYIFEYDKEWVV